MDGGATSSPRDYAYGTTRRVSGETQQSPRVDSLPNQPPSPRTTIAPTDADLWHPPLRAPPTVVDIPVYQRRYSSLYFLTVLGVLAVLLTLIAICVLTWLMWDRLRCNHAVVDPSEGSLQVAYKAGAAIAAGQAVSLWGTTALPGLGVVYSAITPLAKVAAEVPKGVGADSCESTLLVVTQPPSEQTLSIFTSTSGVSTEYSFDVPELQDFLGCKLLSASRAVVWYTTQQGGALHLLATTLTLPGGGQVGDTATVAVAQALPIADSVLTAGAKLTDGTTTASSMVLTWTSTSNQTCHHALLDLASGAAPSATTTISPLECYRRAPASLASVALSSEVVAVAGGGAITLLQSGGTSTLSVLSSQALPELHAAAAPAMALLRFAGQLVVVGGCGAQLAVWTAAVSSPTELGALALRVLQARPRPLTLVHAFSFLPEGSMDSLATSGVFVLAHESSGVGHSVVRLAEVDGQWTPSDVVQGHAAGVGAPVTTATVDGTPLAVFSGAPAAVGQPEWRGGLRAVGIALRGAAAGADVPVQLLGTAVLPEAALTPGVLYYPTAEGGLADTQAAGSLDPDQPLGLAVGAGALRLCRLRHGLATARGAC